MNNVKANKSAHKESVRDLRYILLHISSWIFFMKLFIIKFLPFLTSFCRTDLKFCSCSDDTTVKVWDFARCQEDRSLSGNVP